MEDEDLTKIQMEVLSNIKGHLESNPLIMNLPPILSLAGNEGRECVKVVKTEELFRLFNKYCNVLLELEGEYFLKVLEIYKNDIAIAGLSEDVLYSELRDEVVVEWYWVV